MTVIIISIAIATFLHSLSLAMTAHVLGIRVMSISIGFGPRIIDQKGFTLKLFPFSGCVALLDSRVYPLDEAEYEYAFDLKKRWIRAGLPLLSWLPLIVIAIARLGSEVVLHFIAGLQQIYAGTLHPMLIGTDLIAQAVNLAQHNSVFTVFSLVAIKLCALNLLPLSFFNGGQSLIEFISPPEYIVTWLYRFSTLIFLLLVGSWISAFLNYMHG